MIQIAAINESATVADAQVPAVVAALQRQVREHFAPAWGIDAQLSVSARGAVPAPDSWQLVLLDDSDQADALGYHETTAAGLPLGKVFVRTSTQDGENWPVCASHELLEMLADPWVCDTVLAQTSESAGTLYPREVCDAVEGATYEIDGVQVSDFVLPAYWFPAVPGVTLAGPFDWLKQLQAPLPALLPGGYLGEMAVGVPATGWQQITDMRRLSARHAAKTGSRRHRRTLPRAAWRQSTKG
ncbi:MAG: hypothetical protein ACREFA_07635 [Stellaceae bacterium]